MWVHNSPFSILTNRKKTYMEFNIHFPLLRIKSSSYTLREGEYTVGFSKLF